MSEQKIAQHRKAAEKLREAAAHHEKAAEHHTRKEMDKVLQAHTEADKAMTEAHQVSQAAKT